MSQFIVDTDAIIAATAETFEKFRATAAPAPDPETGKLPIFEAAHIDALIDENQCYIEITAPDIPFIPNPEEPDMALRLFVHKDQSKTPAADYMIGLYSRAYTDEGGNVTHTKPVKLLVGPKATGMFVYMHSCCKKFSALFFFGDPDYKRGQQNAPKVGVAIRDPRTVMPNHAQFFLRTDEKGASFAVDAKPDETSSILFHAALHLEELLSGRKHTHQCSSHATISAHGGTTYKPVPHN